jgi:signal peptidase I
MNNTLYEGDYVFVNKLSYGARFQITLLSVPFGDGAYLDWLQLPYLRMPGFSSVNRNDVIVFNLPSESQLPVDKRKPYVKRCVGLPADTIELRDGKVFVNSMLQTEPATVLAGPPHKKEKEYSPVLFPHNSKVKWNNDFFGPLLIPAKGSSVILNDESVLLYEYCILAEGNTLSIRNDSCFINQVYQTKYVFGFDYYFVLGDNRNNSIDSRFWGLVPENHLIGEMAGSYHPE